jgi:hypothetical protein
MFLKIIAQSGGMFLKNDMTNAIRPDAAMSLLRNGEIQTYF